LTVTVKLQVAVFPHGSVATQFTVVVPFGNAEPLAGVQATPGVPQVSLAVTVKLTVATHMPGTVWVTMFAGHAMVGGVVSTTVMVCSLVAMLPQASVAFQVRTKEPVLPH
jgi:hypothetical protein